MNAHVLTPTPDLSKSLEFYAKLGFTKLPSNGSALVTDGQVLVEIDPERTARAGFKFFDADHSRRLDALSGSTAIHGTDNGQVLSDPNGIRVVLSDNEAPAVDMAGIAPGITGNFAGISIETSEMERSVNFWKALGYAITMGDPAKGWVSLEAAGCPGISLMKPLMCPHLFFNPSLTYFNGKEGNPVVIENVRKAGIPITEEITHFNKEGIVDNITILDPGGLGSFLFND